PRDISADDYLSALHKNWIEPPLQEHLWLLCKMLEEKPGKLSRKLSQYIAAQSRRRIARRFRNQSLSQPYYDSLKRVKDVPPLPLHRKQATNHRPGAAKLDKDEYDSDRRFLKYFLGPYNDKECTTSLDTPIEHLLKMVDESMTGSGNIELYTNDTRTEFHHLLLFLLLRFEESVEQLSYYAYALLRLARGRAFRMHLENIEHLLDDPRHPSAGASTDDYNEEHDHAQQEEDFDGVLLPQKLKSYVAWLRLIVGHFDAVEILARFVKSSSFPYQSIFIQILNPPLTGEDKLDWQKLFTDGPLPDGLLAIKDRNVKEGKCKKTGEYPEIDALRDKLEQHPSAYSFFVSLAHNQLFTGALHCEAHLASILHASTGNTKKIEMLPELQHYGPVIGVSKHCCLVCDHFLNILRPRDDQFLVQGRHGNISACTLPQWTPSLIVDNMNLKFGTILLQDLNCFMDKVNGIQGHTLERSNSTGSGALSLDSDGGHSDGSSEHHVVKPWVL
ncbi:hypothetical protein K443DRAFT_682330, partial [Laccaria amethystina LaAM-08-1]